MHPLKGVTVVAGSLILPFSAAVAGSAYGQATFRHPSTAEPARSGAALVDIPATAGRASAPPGGAVDRPMGPTDATAPGIVPLHEIDDTLTRTVPERATETDPNRSSYRRSSGVAGPDGARFDDTASRAGQPDDAGRGGDGATYRHSTTSAGTNGAGTDGTRASTGDGGCTTDGQNSSYVHHRDTDNGHGGSDHDTTVSGGQAADPGQRCRQPDASGGVVSGPVGDLGF